MNPGRLAAACIIHLAALAVPGFALARAAAETGAAAPADAPAGPVVEPAPAVEQPPGLVLPPPPAPSDDLVVVEVRPSGPEQRFAVAFDSGEACQTPCRLLLRKGRHHLRVVGRNTFEQDVLVTAGRAVLTVGEDGVRPDVPVRFESRDPDAQFTVTVDGGAPCATPCELLLAPGRHVVRADGDAPLRRSRMSLELSTRAVRVTLGKRRLEKEKLEELSSAPDYAFGAGRLRFGLSVGASLASVPQSGPVTDDGFAALELDVRAGVQLTRNLAVTYQGAAVFGSTFLGPSFCFMGPCYRPTPQNLFVPMHASSALFEATFWKVQVALGPALFLAADVLGSPGRPGVVGGGGTLRLAVLPLLKTRSVRQHGISIGLQGQAGFFAGGGRYLGAGLTVGYDTF